jgi:hypothetical protein
MYVCYMPGHVQKEKDPIEGLWSCLYVCMYVHMYMPGHVQKERKFHLNDVTRCICEYLGMWVSKCGCGLYVCTCACLYIYIYIYVRD